METIEHVFQQRQHMLLEDYEIYHYNDSRELHVSLHFHDFYECYLLLSGSISYQIDDATFSMIPGDLLLIGPSQLHRLLLQDPNTPYERIVLWLSRAFVERLSARGADLASCFFAKRRGAYRLTSDQRGPITERLFTLLAASNDSAFGQRVLCTALAAELLVLLNRVCLVQTGPHQRPDVRVSKFAGTIASYLDAHLAEPISLDELAEKVFLSKYHMARAFRKETGVSIYRMLMQKRMIRARDLIREGLPLMAVAEKCGFAEYSGFYKAFRNEYGVSPREYAIRE